MNCPVCRAEAQGAYCSQCGAPLEGAACRQCKAPLVPGARYCVACGHAVRPVPSNVGWYVTAAAVVALVALPVAYALRAAGPASPDATPLAAGAAAGGPGVGSPPPLTGTPREQADRLFNRVMQASSAGDSAEVAFFLPMAIAAYRQAGPLDADGLYHLSVLEAASGDAAGARATAEQILAADADHLLGLAAAARAARAAGQDGAARRFYQRLLEVFDAQRGRALREYADHATILPVYQEEAREFVGR